MKWFGLVLGAVMLGGCVKAPIEGREDPFVPAQVHFASEDLRTHTAVMAPRVSRDAVGNLVVTVPIRAATDLELYVDYRVTFFDAQGQVLNQTHWMSKVLAPNVFDQVEVNSMSPQATDFQIDFRYAK
jgi:hypothetical protein